MSESQWYKIANENEVDSPALLIYPARVKENVKAVIQSIDDINRLRPHIKTHKSPQVSSMMLQAGITKFKCATISEAEMLAVAGARDVLLAYQPIGPKIKRLAELIEEFTDCKFSCLVDNLTSASEISNMFIHHNTKIDVFVDLNVGMNRTGVVPEAAFELVQTLTLLRGINVAGLHAYDGHLRDEDFHQRKKKCDEAFLVVAELAKKVNAEVQIALKIVAGGTPTFSIHRTRRDIECSPGTFIYWDKGYEKILSEQKYDLAAVVLCRVISNPSENVYTVDLGHKAIASENPLSNRISFLNGEDLEAVSHSEEHMVLKATTKSYKVGDVLYGVPYHVCPTVALYDEVNVVEDGKVSDHWYNVSRNRKLTI
jgi:D-threonine aldolase